MDWFNHKRRRENLRRLEETQTEFDLLVQRTVGRITIEQKIRRFVQVFERTSSNSKKIPWWNPFHRKSNNL